MHIFLELYQLPNTLSSARLNFVLTQTPSLLGLDKGAEHRSNRHGWKLDIEILLAILQQQYSDYSNILLKNLNPNPVE